jgi:PAS domain S-box-containing protein
MHGSASRAAQSPAFLAGGGEMGALIRIHHWSATPLGPPETWPQGLRTAVRLLLNTGHPMYIWWGPDLLCFYNDAYRASIGPERHPGSLGRPGREVWDEIWPIIGPQIEHVMAGGGATWRENDLVPITRNGRLEDVYWTYSYGPIDDESAANGVGGVLVVCTETTATVLAERRRAEEAERQRRLFEQAPGFITVLRGPDHKFEFVNAAYTKLFGDRDFIGRTVRQAFPELAGQGFYEWLDDVYRSGERFVAQRIPARLQRSPQGAPEQRYLDFIYEPVKDEAGQITGIFCEGYDVTEAHLAQVALRESEERFRALVDASAQMVWTTDATGAVVEDSPSWRAFTGQTFEEWVGFGWVNAVHPEDRAFGECHWREAVAAERPVDTEFRLRHAASASWRWTTVRAVPLRSDTGAVTGWVGMNADIEDRKQADAALRTNEERLRFLDGLAETTQPLTDPTEIMAVTARSLGEHLGVAVCAYADMEPDQDGFTIRGNWTAPGAASIVGSYKLSGFGEIAVRELRAARPLVTRNTLAELGPEQASLFLQLGLKATVCMPLVKEGRLTALMAVHNASPRNWSDAELALVADTTQRSWAHIERTRSEAALRESEARFRNMADHAPVMIWTTDPTGACIYLNRPWYEFTGQSEAEAAGFGWLEAVHPDDRGWSAEAFFAANAKREAFRVEYRLRRADGIYRWAIDAGSPRFGPAGEFLGFVGSVIDIDDRRGTEEALRHSEEQLRLATEAAEIGLWDLDPTSDTLFWPPRVKAMFGIAPEATISMADFFAGLHPDDREHTSAAFAAALDPYRRALYDVEYRTIGHDDRVVRWVAAKGRAIFNDRGSCVRVLGTAIDITARKAAEERLRELNETLERRVEEQLLERLKAEEALRQAQKMEAVGQLTGGGRPRLQQPAYDYQVLDRPAAPTRPR